MKKSFRIQGSIVRANTCVSAYADIFIHEVAYDKVATKYAKGSHLKLSYMVREVQNVIIPMFWKGQLKGLVKMGISPQNFEAMHAYLKSV